MPGSKMFASREPDAATLAGKSGVPQLPESPASKYSPDNIAAVGRTPATPTSGQVAGTGSAETPPASYGYPSQTVASSLAGSAAKANGYQTGPYQVGSTGAAAVAANLPGGSPSAGLPSPYGGSFSGAPASSTLPDIAIPNSVSGALAQAMPSYPGGPTAAGVPGVATPGGYPPPPTAGSLPQATAGYNSSSNVLAGHSAAPQNYAGEGSSTLGAFPVIPGGTTSTQGTGESSVAPSAYSGTGTLGSYAPGTTGRATSYDFSGGTPGAPTSTPRPSYSLPPNTATGPNQPLLR